MHGNTQDNPEALELAALLCSRVCHDVVNPVGAIINGLEVLDEGGDAELREIAFDLIRKSANQASAKLQFARLAYGAASSSGSTIDLGDAEAVTRPIVESDKHKLIWNVPRLAAPKDMVKLVVNLVLAGIATVPRGGTVTVDAEADGDTLSSITISCTGTNARIPDEVERFVTGRGDWSEVTSHKIQPFYTGLIAKSAGMDVAFDWTGDIISINARRAVSAAPEARPSVVAEVEETDDSVISFATTPLRSA
ncbi:MAG: histidine phosphotransferase [Rhodobiaceae bacterium]|nr:histidine phosphotransferase [Rhodobiaceae bacterium]